MNCPASVWTLAREPVLTPYGLPASALDPETVAELLQIMRELADCGRTAIVVTYEPGFARRAATLPSSQNMAASSIRRTTSKPHGQIPGDE
jgi:ABC-type polar amino acid transport system ATPase subunit